MQTYDYMKTHKQDYIDSNMSLCGITNQPGAAKRTGIILSNINSVDCKTCLMLHKKISAAIKKLSKYKHA